jgi:hypothetical protein
MTDRAHGSEPSLRGRRRAAATGLRLGDGWRNIDHDASPPRRCGGAGSTAGARSHSGSPRLRARRIPGVSICKSHLRVRCGDERRFHGFSLRAGIVEQATPAVGMGPRAERASVRTVSCSQSGRPRYLGFGRCFEASCGSPTASGFGRSHEASRSRHCLSGFGRSGGASHSTVRPDLGRSGQSNGGRAVGHQRVLVTALRGVDVASVPRPGSVRGQ